ncbi:SDR family oxidoreductase [Chlorobium limicola]
MIPKYSGTVLVAGATGRTGQQIVINLQRRGISYRLFVRSAEKARSLFGNDVEGRIVAGSAENPDDIRRAVEGIDAVICAIGGAVTDPEAPPPSAIDRDAIIRLASMAKQSGAKQFILISSLAVTKPDHPLNKYGRVLDMKLEGENGIRKLFKDEGHTYTIIRPGGLLDGPPMQHRLLLDTGDRITGSIDRSDVAEIAVLALIVPAARNRTFELIRQDEAPQDSLDHYFDLLL